MKEIRELPLGSKMNIDGYSFVIVDRREDGVIIDGVGEGMTPEEFNEFYLRHKDLFKKVFI